MRPTFRAYPRVQKSLAALHGTARTYAADVATYLLGTAQSWPKYATYDLSEEEAKHVRRGLTTALMLDLDAING